MIGTTHTYVVLEISPAAWHEIASKLREAGYSHAFMGDGEIDMHGIAVKSEDLSERKRTATESSAGQTPKQ